MERMRFTGRQMMRVCKSVNQVDGIPEQCRACRFLGQCLELGCTKEKPCASKVEKEAPDIRDEIRME